MAMLPFETNYIVTLGIGTPKKELSLSFDIGSYLTWTQCKAASGYYFKQKHPLFDPSKFKTFTSLKCPSPLCTGDDESICFSLKCGYKTTYGDNSTSKGAYGLDSRTLSSSEVIDNFLFGCSINNSGIFQESEEDGILGLSQQKFSILHQTAKKYHQVFSYYIPSKPGYTGFLRFGGRRRKSLMCTPTTNYMNRSYYGLEMIGISVAGKKLPIPSSVFTKTGTIIDSGTIITRMPTEIYKPYNYHKKSNVTVVDLSGIAVDMASSSIAIPVNSTIVCFGFSAQVIGIGAG